jgi:16S rRNA (adenine1518-N6/adenine1519-N6)-dimethyltransferase
MGIDQDIPGLMRRYGLRPQKKLGQNFLVDEAALRRVVEAAQIQRGQAVLEVGPGLGSLTSLLAQAAVRVVCVELDQNLILPLEEILGVYPNVEIVSGDILKLDPGRLMAGSDSYLVVANIPYYITSALIRHLIEAPQPPLSLVLTVQLEVAERICAQAGEMSLLALSVQVYGQPVIVSRIPAGAFYPPPQVDSAVIRVLLHPQPAIPRDRLPLFFRLAKAGFSQKRKMLRNALSAGMRWSPSEAEALLSRSGIDAMRRAETLSLEEWKRVVETAGNGDSAL